MGASAKTLESSNADVGSNQPVLFAWLRGLPSTECRVKLTKKKDCYGGTRSGCITTALPVDATRFLTTSFWCTFCPVTSSAANYAGESFHRLFALQTGSGTTLLTTLRDAGWPIVRCASWSLPSS